MRIAIIGRTEALYNTAKRLSLIGHHIGLIITSKEAPEYQKTADDFRQLAEKNQIPFFCTPKIASLQETIENMEPFDIGISHNYIGIIPAAIIKLFRLGILNAHGGDLPRYRGNACQAWAILNGESRIGLCIHKMSMELDSGDIIVRDYLPIDISTKVGHALGWISENIPNLFEQAIGYLEKDEAYLLEKQSKNPKDTLRCYPRLPEDGWINWNDSNEKIVRLVNASNKPYAGAFCNLDGDTLIIWDACLVNSDPFLAVPGQITEIGDGYVNVACGKGMISLREVEINGYKGSPSSIICSIRRRLR